MEELTQYLNQIRQLCEKHNVSELFVFGSVLGRTFNEGSDVDFVVDFSDVSLEEYADNYFDLKFSLEKLLKRDVDLLEDKAIRNPYLRKSIDSTKQLIYEV
ncbi:MAG: nucleotidyltransferase domain-containing protein [Bacteroidales bacterium]